MSDMIRNTMNATQWGKNKKNLRNSQLYAGCIVYSSLMYNRLRSLKYYISSEFWAKMYKIVIKKTTAENIDTCLLILKNIQPSRQVASCSLKLNDSYNIRLI